MRHRPVGELPTSSCARSPHLLRARPAAYVGPVTTRATNDMTYRQLGDSGLTVSTVGLGCNNFGRRLDQEGTTAVVNAAIDAGVTLFDTADIYGLRRERGDARCGAGQPAGERRGGNEVRHGHAGRQRARLGRARIAALRRARRSRPACAGSAPTGSTSTSCTVPTRTRRSSETLAALDELVREGKVRYIGSSNFTGWQVVDADWTARTAGTERFVSAQNEYSLLERDVEEELGARLRARRRRAAAVLPARIGPADRQVPPRRGGARRGRRLASMGDAARRGADWDTIERLEGYAAERGLRLHRRRHRRPRGPAGGGLGHRRGDPPEQVRDNVRGRARGSRPSPTSPPSTRSPSNAEVPPSPPDKQADGLLSRSRGVLERAAGKSRGQRAIEKAIRPRVTTASYRPRAGAGAPGTRRCARPVGPGGRRAPR